ncbi:hypothetical protein KKD81_00935 [Patescibacteria group bacterium]|nr:hypothetical protein [Patescibacteria group bacterium]MBU2220484.1 hypothetical protein [Patescibacteria group bacterium]
MIDGYVIYPELWDVSVGAKLVVRILRSGVLKVRRDPDAFAYGLLRAQVELKQRFSFSFENGAFLIEGYTCSAVRGPDIWAETNNFLCLLDMCTGLTFSPVSSSTYTRRFAA